MNVNRDYSESFKWFLRAAKQGNRNAQLNVARMYQDGIGVAKDNGSAEKWFAKAEVYQDRADKYLSR